jgi:hypothetical protein
MTATRLVPVAGTAIADPSSGTAALRQITWPVALATYVTSYILLSSDSATVPSYLVTTAVATKSGRAIPAGGSPVAFGPYAVGTDLWVYGATTDDVQVSFDGVFSEGFR